MIATQAVKRSAIADAARSLIGVPFHHQGRSRAGLDCAGLVVMSLRLAGLEDIPDTIDYGPMPDPATLLQRLQSIATTIDRTQIVPGDLVCMRWREQRGTHVGIITRCGSDGLVTFVHSYQLRGMAVEDLLGSMWVRRLYSCWRVSGVSDG